MPQKKLNKPHEYRKSKQRRDLEEIAHTVLKISSKSKREDLALYIDTLYRWLDYKQQEKGKGFITFNHHKIARKVDISLRTSKSYLADVKKLNLLNIQSLYHPKFGKQIVAYRKGTTEEDENVRQKVIHQRENLTKLKGKPSSQNPCIARDKQHLLSRYISKYTMSMSIPLSTRAKTDKDYFKKNGEDKKPLETKQPPSSEFALKASALFISMIVVNLSKPISTNQKTLEKLLLPLQKSHLPTLEAFKAYLFKVAINPFLMGKKPNKDGKLWELRLEHILSGKMIEQSWSSEGFFNVYTPQSLGEGKDNLLEKRESVKLSTLTWDEVKATARDENDIRIKHALFQKLGADTYKTWFFNNSFTFEGMEGRSALFIVEGSYACKIISERYSHFMTEVGKEFYDEI